MEGAQPPAQKIMPYRNKRMNTLCNSQIKRIFAHKRIKSLNKDESRTQEATFDGEGGGDHEYALG